MSHHGVYDEIWLISATSPAVGLSFVSQMLSFREMTAAFKFELVPHAQQRLSCLRIT